MVCVTRPLPVASIFDLDGTIADVIPFRHLVQRPKGKQDFEAFHRAGVTIAKPIPETVDHLEQAREAGHQILVVSGRGTKWAEPSARWLRRNGVHFDHLWARPRGFGGDDRAVKREIYRRHIQGRFAVVRAFDDQPRIAEVWRSLGIPVTLIPGWTDADEVSMGYTQK